MRISVNWLREYIDTELPTVQIAEILTDIGLEVEKVERYESLSGSLQGVVVGEVIEVHPHPDADRLRVTSVDTGGAHLLQIVCGAPNVAAGQKVLVATVGTRLYPSGKEPFDIRKSKIRGVDSEGMICAEDELGLGESHEGIMVLPADATPGDTAADYLGIYCDEAIEIGLTPNRTDAMGHFGVARDLAARLSLELRTRARLPEVPSFSVNGQTPPISVEIVDREGCGKYTGITLVGVKVEPSPAWMQHRLKAIGINPINNVVDITNYVLHETGQPLHAFDADKIRGGSVMVQTLPDGTKFTTLDGVERTLTGDDVMICDSEGPMCIAGVLGGIESGVSDATSRIFLESAWFNSSRVRRAARKHGLNTDASFRFERGTDPTGVAYALRRAASLLIDICGANPDGGEVVAETVKYEHKAIHFSLERCNALCGTSIKEGVLKEILDALGFEILSENNGIYRLQVPPYRVDVTREEDVVEEVLRIFGYNEVTMPSRMQISLSYPPKPPRHEVLHHIATVLSGRGFTEIMCNGLTRSEYFSEALTQLPDAHSLVQVLNPLSQELDVLRPGLMWGMLDTVAYNLNRQSERLMLFELGTIYLKAEESYREETHLAIALLGNRFPENWNNPAMPFDGSDMLGHLHAMLEAMGIACTFEASVSKGLLQVTALRSGGRILGYYGYVHQQVLKMFGIKRKVIFAELDMDTCLSLTRHASKKYSELPKYPFVRRDFSLMVDKEVTFASIEKLSRKRAGKLLRSVNLFDVYEGKNLPEGKKSYAVSYTLQDIEGTLNDAAIDRCMEDIRKSLEKELGATLR